MSTTETKGRETCEVQGGKVPALHSEEVLRGLPGGPVVRNLPAKGDTGSIPGLGAKIPHATEQLSPCATITEPALYSL